ncbi:antitoxin VapB family protein [Candidatus Woesearchaeota archaeon]|nr:antitoxin VapB family protein [Candidatus Woesearchaeota archaeon]
MVKVISLSNKAYQVLQEIKGSTESFSDVVIRLAQKGGDVLSLFGCAQKDTEFIKGIKKAYLERDIQQLREY